MLNLFIVNRICDFLACCCLFSSLNIIFIADPRDLTSFSKRVQAQKSPQKSEYLGMTCLLDMMLLGFHWFLNIEFIISFMSYIFGMILETSFSCLIFYCRDEFIRTP
ncbi:hypothetical protein CsSME_00019431 [Camellia sinensis var. sinensis]